MKRPGNLNVACAVCRVAAGKPCRNYLGKPKATCPSRGQQVRPIIDAEAKAAAARARQPTLF